MEMTTIQRDALARARRGDFELADAIELEARINRNAYQGDIVVGFRSHRLIALGEGEQNYDGCSACGARGQVRCSKCDRDGLVECPMCEGKGNVPGPLGVATECPKCAGTKEIECPECGAEKFVDCGACDGEGDLPGPANLTRIVDLNGRTLWEEGGGEDEPYLGEQVGIEWAQIVICKYHDEAAAEGAAATNTEEAA